MLAATWRNKVDYNVQFLVYNRA